MGETVRLKNGTEEAETLVAIVMGLLEHLVEERPLALYDLMMCCRDGDHSFWGDNEEYLRELRLVDSDGVVHESDRNVILSAVEGDGFDMVLKSPLAQMP